MQHYEGCLEQVAEDTLSQLKFYEARKEKDVYSQKQKTYTRQIIYEFQQIDLSSNSG